MWPRVEQPVQPRRPAWRQKDGTGATFGGSGRETGTAFGGAGRHKDAVVDIIAKPLCRDECHAQLEDCCRHGDNDVDAPPSKFVGVTPLRFAELFGSYASGDDYFIDPLQMEVLTSMKSSSCTAWAAKGCGGDDTAAARPCRRRTSQGNDAELPGANLPQPLSIAAPPSSLTL